jgi:hypothetical protein
MNLAGTGICKTVKSQIEGEIANLYLLSLKMQPSPWLFQGKGALHRLHV